MTRGTSGAMFLPGDFYPHRATYLLWPSRGDNWRDGAAHAQRLITDLANLIACHEPVCLGHSVPISQGQRDAFAGPIELFPCEYDDIWIRDTGPTFLLNELQAPLAIDWIFNSWGGLFNSVEQDDAVARQIATREQCPCRKVQMVLEGGAILTDGCGTIVTTEECLLAHDRNPNLTKSNIEDLFKRELGCHNVIWLPCGLAHDEAGGHIDNVCAFVDETRLLLSHTDERGHPSYHHLKEAERILSESKNIFGDGYEIIRLPLPPETCITPEEATGFEPAHGFIKRAAGTPLAPSYVNIYIANGLVVAPVFGVPTDALAVQTLRDVFGSQRKIVPFPSREFLLGGGAVHCLTREVPQWTNNRSGS